MGTHWNDMCHPCGKANHYSRKEAAHIAAFARREHRQVITHYKCEHGAWHVGHPPTRAEWVHTIARMERAGITPILERTA